MCFDGASEFCISSSSVIFSPNFSVFERAGGTRGRETGTLEGAPSIIILRAAVQVRAASPGCESSGRLEDREVAFTSFLVSEYFRV